MREALISTVTATIAITMAQVTTIGSWEIGNLTGTRLIKIKWTMTQSGSSSMNWQEDQMEHLHLHGHPQIRLTLLALAMNQIVHTITLTVTGPVQRTHSPVLRHPHSALHQFQALHLPVDRVPKLIKIVH